ncbi:hypothetical protein NVP1015O_31 [Vibrio phage 1.015.O._10N.222.51.E5]|nr:hypothetical protein NVP1015O_31 [Vibrio phage 1.015.O._10N.222.51.E5]AUR83393.1 hypothetical protein NVP1034O_30 [Vibrio phage 1.034.O._10N.261.46.B7]AUR83461.1 hypothetical protein NVP1034X_31 [Vibrio phage 1.034.X._10N.261.46.B7]AUR90199.1 coil containing protein [Vibrio phage 1.139.A._10N.261.48.C6]AUR90266.1 coil containing protein [Vibrio phage 1.139.B._10N.261.48.C6]AUR95587.1 coil containing protein [Vibrio phage 1.209.O._10N.222.52.B2]
MASPRYSKAKGREFQNQVRDAVRAHLGRSIREDDVTTAVMGESGVDIKLSPHARDLFPFSLECKRVERLSLFEAYQQSCDNHYENTIPAVVWRRNNKKTLICMSLDDFLEYIKELR